MLPRIAGSPGRWICRYAFLILVVKTDSLNLAVSFVRERSPTGALLAVVALACGLLGSCALAPATIYRPWPRALAAGGKEANLHRNLTLALDDGGGAAADRALGRFVEGWAERGLGNAHTLPPPAPGGVTYRVRMAGASDGCYPIEYFDTLDAVSELKVGKIPRYGREGVGAPLVALRENRQREPVERYFPPEAITRALTAYATAGPLRDGVRDVEIRLLCPLAFDTVETIRGPEPLAADFSAPWAALLARAGDLRLRGVTDTLTPRPARETQLYLMEPYDPRKEPLIMIHGLYATPLIWAKVSNELWADDEIRRRYQIWHFHYNTSAPALYSARLLRAQLREVRALLDPSGRDPAMRRTTLLAHSMGGLISKAMVTRPGDAFFKAAFEVPPEKLKLTPEDRVLLHEAFQWEPDRSVHRIIYVAVPHRGSDYADNAIGQIGRWITAPPHSFRTFFERISEANPGAFTPAYEELSRGRLNSVSSLSPSQPSLRILADLPYAHPVKTHSIIGTRGFPGPLEKSSDGVVAYSSSHLPDVESELIVPADHWTYRHPAAVDEIKRILKLPR